MSAHVESGRHTVDVLAVRSLVRGRSTLIGTCLALLALRGGIGGQIGRAVRLCACEEGQRDEGGEAHRQHFGRGEREERGER